jgi:hypothetical protein
MLSVGRREWMPPQLVGSLVAVLGPELGAALPIAVETHPQRLWVTLGPAPRCDKRHLVHAFRAIRCTCSARPEANERSESALGRRAASISSLSPSPMRRRSSRNDCSSTIGSPSATSRWTRYTLQRPLRRRSTYPALSRSLNTRYAWRSVMPVASAISVTRTPGFRATASNTWAWFVRNAQPRVGYSSTGCCFSTTAQTSTLLPCLRSRRPTKAPTSSLRGSGADRLSALREPRSLGAPLLRPRSRYLHWFRSLVCPGG